MCDGFELHIKRQADEAQIGASVIGVALSGGADSVALMAALTAVGVRVVALHCNFHLRGDESDRDEAFCRRLCEDLGVQLLVNHVDVAARREATGESVEMACRELRYRWFAQQASALGLAVVAVAHHRDDQVETFFLNLLRGSGVRGLRGMQTRNGLYWRPLLGMSRSDILDYLARRRLSYVTDSTNLEDEYKRNRLRNRVIPAIESCFPGASEAIARSMGHLADQWLLLDDLRKSLIDRYIENGVIDVARLCKEEAHPREALYHLLDTYGFNSSEVADIYANPDGNGRRFGSWELRGGRLTLHNDISGQSPTEFEPLRGNDVITSELVDVTADTPLRCGRDEMVVDFAASTGRWELRPWREGDRIRPYGMKGSRLVSDIMAEHGLSLAERRQARVLTRDGVVMWVAPLRASSHFPVTADTRKAIRLRWIGYVK